MSTATPLHVFSGCGIELEYMIVDRDTLDVRPIADELLRLPDGSWSTDRDRGAGGVSPRAIHPREDTPDRPPRAARTRAVPHAQGADAP